MKPRLLAGIAAGAACLGLLLPATAADAAPTAKHYRNCAAVHRDYTGGIVKKGVTRDTTHYKGKTRHHAIRGHYIRSDSLYQANKRLDQDNDGIACELYKR